MANMTMQFHLFWVKIKYILTFWVYQKQTVNQEGGFFFFNSHTKAVFSHLRWIITPLVMLPLIFHTFQVANKTEILVYCRVWCLSVVLMQELSWLSRRILELNKDYLSVLIPGKCWPGPDYQVRRADITFVEVNCFSFSLPSMKRKWRLAFVIPSNLSPTCCFPSLDQKIFQAGTESSFIVLL